MSEKEINIQSVIDGREIAEKVYEDIDEMITRDKKRRDSMKYDFINKGPIYAIPVINGITIKSSTDFQMVDDKAYVTIVVPDNKARDTLTSVFERKNHSLRFYLGELESTILFEVFEDCDIKIKEIDSKVDHFTEITLGISER